MNILTLQSQVAYGHVGNSAAAFALQRVGHEAWAAPTVLLSNHPGYGQARGGPVDASLIEAMVEGLETVGALERCNGVLTGYLPSSDVGEATLAAALRARALSAARGRPAVWLCDPVFGDEGRVYARAGVLDFLRERAIPEADVVTPNLFELETLTGGAIASLAAARRAMTALRAKGPALVVCTSFDRETPEGWLDALALDASGLTRVRTPRFDRRFEGAGDLFSALFLAALLEGGEAGAALARACAGVAATLEATMAADARELRLVAAQESMAAAFARGGQAERIA